VTDGGGVCNIYSGVCTCAPGRYSVDCSQACNCSNQTCADGSMGDGSCTCDPLRFFPDCSGVCNCSVHGVCVDGADGDGRCVCSPGYWDRVCGSACPGLSNGPVCSGHGLCADGNMGDGTCQCEPGYFDDACSSFACDRIENCSDCLLHNECGFCGGYVRQCLEGVPGIRESERRHGPPAECPDQYWEYGSFASCPYFCPDFSTCKDCQAVPHFGSLVSGGHIGCGWCESSGACLYNDGPTDGGGGLPATGVVGNVNASASALCPAWAYDGELCPVLCPNNCTNTTGGGLCLIFQGECVCSGDRYGVDCSGVCDCADTGTCRSGAVGDGVCICDFGHWSPSCNETCFGFAVNGNITTVCSGHGVCDSGHNGTGKCLCDRGWWGPSCEGECKSCSGHGDCDDGASGSGTCLCHPPWTSTANCSRNICPDQCGGHGTCRSLNTTAAVCDCNPGYYTEDCSQFSCDLITRCVLAFVPGMYVHHVRPLLWCHPRRSPLLCYRCTFVL
jgi:hypothetical protein